MKFGELLIEKSGGGENQPVGTVVRFTLAEAAVCSNFVARVIPASGQDSRYLCYLHRCLYESRWNTRSIKQNTGIQNLDSDAYFNDFAPNPPLDEQAQIADFLDRETAKIDGLITKKRELIERLKEKRTALISHVVTKGLPAEEAAKYGLPVNPPLKPSGIPWLGDIPDHWSVMPWKRLVLSLKDFGSNGSFAGLKENVTYLRHPDFAQLVRLTDLRRGFSDEDGVYVSEDDYHYLKHSSLYGGEFLIANVGANAGYVCEMPDLQRPATLGPNMMVLKAWRKSYVELKYLIVSGQSEVARSQLAMLANAASAQPKLNKDDVKSVVLPLPPLQEQKHILDYILVKSELINQSTERILDAIDKLHEYRSALITAAVTGKIDVREEVAS